MDPTANLKEQIEIARRMQTRDDAQINEPEKPVEQEALDREIYEGEQVLDGLRLAELVLALDGWIRGGGFLPDRWRGTPKEGN